MGVEKGYAVHIPVSIFIRPLSSSPEENEVLLLLNSVSYHAKPFCCVMIIFYNLFCSSLHNKSPASGGAYCWNLLNYEQFPLLFVLLALPCFSRFCCIVPEYLVQ